MNYWKSETYDKIDFAIILFKRYNIYKCSLKFVVLVAESN